MLLGVFLCVASIVSVIPVPTSACHWIKDVFVMGKYVDLTDFNLTINGCIERVRFDGRSVEQLYIRGQTIGVLGKDSVRHLVKLKTISFWGNRITSVSPGAFRNLPQLKNVQLSYGNIKEIPRNLFHAAPEIELLRIHDNEIDIIEDQAFAIFFSLKRIYASDNKLEYWNREWFTNSTALEIMDFQSNVIRTIPRRAFANLRKLRQIFFDFNEISVIHSGAFAEISNLEYLGLRHNRLTEIHEDIFPNDISIRSFLIDANYLNFLPNDVLKKISVKDITIDNNPWKCPCLDRLLYWIYRTNGTLQFSKGCTGPHVPVCSYSTSFSQTCLEHVDNDLTRRYINYLKTLTLPLPRLCARLD